MHRNFTNLGEEYGNDNKRLNHNPKNIDPLRENFPTSYESFIKMKRSTPLGKGSKPPVTEKVR